MKSTTIKHKRVYLLGEVPEKLDFVILKAKLDIPSGFQPFNASYLSLLYYDYVGKFNAYIGSLRGTISFYNENGFLFIELCGDDFGLSQDTKHLSNSDEIVKFFVDTSFSDIATTVYQAIYTKVDKCSAIRFVDAMNIKPVAVLPVFAKKLGEIKND